MSIIGPSRDPVDAGLVTQQTEDAIWATVFAPRAVRTANEQQRGEVFTPQNIINEMLSKLPASLWTDPGLRWFEPSAGQGQFVLEVYRRLRAHHTHDHIVRNMLFMSEIEARNASVCRSLFGPHANIYTGNTLTAPGYGGWAHTFDVVFGNPPFNTPSGAKRNRENQLWRLFLNRALDSWLVKGGYFCFLHPPGWRLPGDELFLRMQNLNVLYLSMHDQREGQLAFKSATRFDWYALRNEPAGGPTTVRDDRHIEHAAVSLRDMTFLPNSCFESVRRLLPRGTEAKCRVLWNNVYIDKDCVPQPTATYNKPVVYTVGLDPENKGGRVVLKGNHGTALLQYTNKDSTVHYGVPKVIFRRTSPLGTVSDPDGSLRMACWCIGIAAPAEQHDMLQTWVTDNQLVLKALSISGNDVSHKLLGELKHEFWKFPL